MSKFFRSSIGSKIIMALSGLFLIVFIMIHLLGNLGMFAGRETFNDYAAFLHSKPVILWVLRIFLIFAALAHIFSSIRLNAKNRSANGLKYKKKAVVKATLQSRMMMFGGVTILCFLIYHLAHFTFGFVDPKYINLVNDQGEQDVYNMVIAGFQNIYIVLFYLLGQFFLGLHLSHGFFSAAQTLGVTQGVPASIFKVGGCMVSATIIGLYVSIPLSISLGIISYVY